MKFETTAIIKEIGEIETIGAKGFQKRNVILTESGEYENLVCVEFSGEKLCDPERYQIGQSVKVGGFINCREWNGKYFSSLRGSYIQTDRNVAPQEETQQATAPQNQQYNGQAPDGVPIGQQPQRTIDPIYQPPPQAGNAEDDIPF